MPLVQASPRQSFYLRISPTTVVQMLVFVEPHYVDWFSASDQVLGRILVTLRERIPLKLRQEAAAYARKSSSATKASVDMYRGSDFQVAYYFRSSPHKHYVLLKSKELVFSRPSELADDVFAEDDQDDKEAILGKPQVQVDYSGFQIFGRSLVVIAEPYPPFKAADIPKAVSNVRQLSSDVVSDWRSRSRSASRMASRTPAAGPSDRLFREQTTESERTPAREGSTASELPSLEDLLQ